MDHCDLLIGHTELALPAFLAKPLKMIYIHVVFWVIYIMQKHTDRPMNELVK